MVWIRLLNAWICTLNAPFPRFTPLHFTHAPSALPKILSPCYLPSVHTTTLMLITGEFLSHGKPTIVLSERHASFVPHVPISHRNMYTNMLAYLHLQQPIAASKACHPPYPTPSNHCYNHPFLPAD